MKKTITKFKKIAGITTLLLFLATMAHSQCTPAFSYTLGSSGLVNFASTTAGTSGTAHYNWNFGFANNTDTGITTSYTYPFNGTYNVTLYINDSTNSCWGNVTNTITINNTAPQPPCQSAFTYTLGAGGQVMLTSTSTTYTGSPTYYTWNFGGNAYDSAYVLPSPTHTYIYNGTYTVSLNVYNPFSGCNSISSQVITISNANNAPACTSAFTYTLGSTGLVSFTSLYTGSSSSPTFNWNFNYQGNNSTSAATSFTYPYNGTYYVTLTVKDSANFACNGSTTNTIVITNTATQPCVPTASFSVLPDSLYPGMSIWNVNPNYSSQVSSAVWSWGDGTSTAGMYPSHTYAAAGWYTICVEVYASCGDSSSTCQMDSVYRMAHNSTSANMVTVTVIGGSNGIKTNTNAISGIKIYPNPFTDNLTVNLSSYQSNNVICAMYDMMGNLILKENVLVNKGDNEFKLKTDGLNQGVYFVNIVGNDGKKVSTLKVVK